ncbi:MAG TPA: hypothetical protein VEB86_03375 [Chryseosolibacter sp.]|nr:hypothetical protein [Chryseosolibacter sp.]
MRPIHFNDLSLRDKALLLDDFGVLLCSIEHYDHRVYLYALNNLFVEAYHNIETKAVDRVTMAEPADLDKFLARISIYNYKKPENHQL